MFPVNFISFGESTYKGYSASIPPDGVDHPESAVPTLIFNTVSNSGVSIAYTNKALDSQTLSQNSAGHVPFMNTKDLIVLVNSGLNDAYNNNVNGFKTTLKELIDEARFAGKIVIVQSPNAINSTDLTWKNRVNTIRTYINNSLNGSLGVKVEVNPVLAGTDLVHPTADGYATMATNLTNSNSLMAPAAIKTIGLSEVVSRLYIAGLARAPEQSGLDYWVGELLASHLTEAQCSQNIVNANSTFNSMNNAQFISAIYANIFNDGSADPSGQSYWVTQLSTKSRGQVVLDITIASVTYSGTDSATLARQHCFNNKIKMALAYGLCARNNNIMNPSVMSAITNVDSTVTSYTSQLFPELP